MLKSQAPALVLKAALLDFDILRGRLLAEKRSGYNQPGEPLQARVYEHRLPFDVRLMSLVQMLQGPRRARSGTVAQPRQAVVGIHFGLRLS
jgi:hypothetical protein